MPRTNQSTSQIPAESPDSIHISRPHDLFVDWQTGTSNPLAVVCTSPTESRLELLVEASIRTAPVLGRAARATLQVWMLAVLAGAVENDVDSGTYDVNFERRQMADTWGRFLREHRPSRLLAERRDEEHRDRAVQAYRWRQQHRKSTVRASAEVTYLEIWRQRLEKLIACGRGPFRMAVQNIAADEMRDHLLLELVEALADPTRFESFQRPAVEASLRLILRAKDRMRRPYVRSAPYDDESETASDDSQSPEKLYHAVETSNTARASLEAMVSRLTPVQRQWFEAALACANEDLPSEQLSRAAVARRLGRSRAEATRQFETMRRLLCAIDSERDEATVASTGAQSFAR